MSDDFDDLDNELLGLGDEGELDDDRSEKGRHSPAGDESEGAVSDDSDGESRRKKKVTTVVTSPSPPPAGAGGRGAAVDSDDDSDEPLPGRKVVSSRKRASPGDDASSPPKKRAKATKKSIKRKRKGDDSDEDDDDNDDMSDYSDEMEVSEASVGGAGVASSDDDDSDGEPAVPSLYPYLHIYKNAADKAHIDSLPEIQKEQILAERADEIFKVKEVKELKDRAKREKREAERRKKREAEALAAASGARRSTRGESSAKQTATSKKNAQLNELMKRRDEKSARRAGGGDGDKSRKKRNETPSHSEGEEDESDSEPVWASQEKASSNKKGTEEASLSDIKLLIVGRSTIAKYWAYPGFEEATIGCFARICIGNHPESGRMIYRLCTIKAWQDSRHIYEITGSDRTVKFRRNALIVCGSDEKPTRVDVFSDSSPSDDEFRWWCGAMEVAGMKRPTVGFVDKKRQETKRVWQRQLTNDDFEVMRRKKTSYYPDDPIIPYLDVPGIRKLRAQMVDAGNEPEILKLDRELEWRAPPKAIAAAAIKGLSPLDKLTQINKRNREINRHDIRMAQIEEKKRNEMAAKHAAEYGDSSFMDPFARVKTYAKIYHDDPTMKKNGKKDDTDMEDLFGAEDGTPAPSGTNGAGLGKTDDKVPQVKAKKATGIDAVIAGLDLQFDIDFSK